MQNLLLLLQLPALLIKWLCIYAIRLYQLLLSPLLPPSCRFQPSCSEYFIQALKKRGLLVGFALGVW
ncbi:MAG: membrane protein insertion efficiency factor YidD, partial [Planctomycetota bacterium]